MIEKRNPKEIVSSSSNPDALIAASAWYGEAFLLRFVVQLLPLGGPLDMVMSGLGDSHRADRLRQFMIDTSRKIERIPEDILSQIAGDTAEMSDFWSNVLQRVAGTRSADKRQMFANLVANNFATTPNWDEAEEAVRILDNLTVNQLRVLDLAVNVAISDNEHYREMKIFTVDALAWHGEPEVPNLGPELPEIPPEMLRFVLAELVSKGLVKDEGVGRIGIAGMQIFRAMPPADWIMRWVADPPHG